MWRAFLIVSFVLIVAAGGGILVRAGWIPWTAPAVIGVLGFVLFGIAARRNRGTQTPAAVREPHTKLHRQDLATNPLPDKGPER
jgi:hypothetical protein